MFDVYGLYRSPSGDIDQFFNEFENFLNNLSRHENLIITGDMNINIDPRKDLSLRENLYLDTLAHFEIVIVMPATNFLGP